MTVGPREPVYHGAGLMTGLTVRPDDCRRCDRHAERVAELLVQLRKAARELHHRLGHATTNFLDCRETPCRDHAMVALGTRTT